jgi:hypothetical protein
MTGSAMVNVSSNARPLPTDFVWVPRAATPEPSTPHGMSKAGTTWTHHLIAYALDRFHRQHLRTPTLRELRAGIPDLPSHGTIKRIYGGHGKMLLYHGYKVRSCGAQPGHPCTLERGARGRFLARSFHRAEHLDPPTGGVRARVDGRDRNRGVASQYSSR